MKRTLRNYNLVSPTIMYIRALMVLVHSGTRNASFIVRATCNCRKKTIGGLLLGVTFLTMSLMKYVWLIDRKT